VATDLYLLGTGVRDQLHLTPETRQALSACTEVYVLHVDPAAIKAVQEHCDTVIDVADMYEGVSVRREAYEAISHRLVTAAAERSPVGFVVQGHPMFLVSATEFTLDLAAEHGLGTQVLPGVSSFDTVLCDLRLDLGYGVQVFDTSTLLQQGWVPNPNVPMLLFQLATTLDQAVVRGARTGEVLQPIVDLLLPLYGAEHETRLVYSASGLLETSETVTVPLGRLAGGNVDLTRRPTLYVPAR
jgi:hypothetical protein